jgi:TetR/AcrR family transcriptional regulator, ethionamide resistance regulator
MWRAIVMDKVKITPRVDDYRVAVGAARRKRMRDRILQSTMRAVAQAPGDAQVTVEDILTWGGISRGTFYNHFTSADEAVSSVGSMLADEFSESVFRLRGGIDSPPRHIAVADHLFLIRAVIEPAWGAYVVRSANQDLLKGESMAKALQMGLVAGDFKFTHLRNAIDFLSGSIWAATRRIIRTKNVDTAYICDLQTMILRGLGVDPSEVEAVMDYTLQYVRNRGPELGWWRDIDKPARAGKNKT